ncbi:MAG: phosphoribosylanthranilate isomerase [Oscillospiraceae bacterium]|nr:phosphoribosylanthranilate isomerase [Oscillospiraceae bacterium]
MSKLKICGLMSGQDSAYANAVCPDFAGMILSSGFRRSISWDTAVEIREKLNQEIPLVGVFVNAELDDIQKYTDSQIIQYIQLHGQEDAAYISAVQKATGLPVIKAFQVKSAENIQQAESCNADMVLLDSGTGSGKQFDWSLLSAVKRTYFLAGGLSPENAAQVLEHYQPFALDVSSGVETDGKKDFQKMKDMAETVRAWRKQ